jgi:hypothetical protein
MDAVFAVCGWYIELIYSLLPDGNVSFAQIISADRRRPLPNDTEKVRIMVVNCQSLRKRKDIFQTSIAKMRPDVIIGTVYVGGTSS